jgi:ribosome-associated protein
MREIDAEPVREAVEIIRARERSQHKIFHQAERWRDRIIDAGDEAIEQLVQTYPDADRQRLRSLLLIARKESDGDRQPAAARALFRYVRDLIS